MLLTLRSVRRPVIAAAVVAALALVVLAAAGCGDDPTPEERYAESACSALVASGQELLDIHQAVNDTRPVPVRDARASLGRYSMLARDSARELRRKLRAIPVPDTAEGTEAANYIRVIGESFDSGMTEQVKLVNRLPQSITLVQSVHGLDQLEDSLFLAFSNLGTYDIVEVRVPEAWDAFAQAESCKELDALGQG